MKSAANHRWKASFLVAALLAPFLAVFSAASKPPSFARSRQSLWKPGKPKSVAAAPAKALPMPFRVGEALGYRVAWAAFTNAASVQLIVPERRELFGWGTWHFRASAHTLSPVRSLFAIDDQFDSYTDAATLESRQYEMYLNEMGRQRDQVLHFLPVGETSRAHGANVVVLAGTRDPLGALYALRGVDWRRTPGFRAPVYDGRDVYEMRATLENPAEIVAVAAGSFSASRVSIHLFQHDREVSAIGFVVWLANDAARTPVLIQAVLPFGNLRAELISASQ